MRCNDGSFSPFLRICNFGVAKAGSFPANSRRVAEQGQDSARTFIPAPAAQHTAVLRPFRSFCTSTEWKFSRGNTPMKKADLQAIAANLIKRVKRWRLNSSCADRCKAQYERELKRCNGDRDCITKATGKYVICVLSCNW